MLEIDQNIIATLKADTTLTAVVPATNILTGPVDIVSLTNTAKGLVLPAIVLWTVSEVQRSVPQYARDTLVQLDVYSKNSQLEVETIYERIVTDLGYVTTNQGTAHICWQILGGAHDVFDTERRIFHRVAEFNVWAVKPR